jgi:hypothetical protein
MANLHARLLKTFGFLTDAGFSLEISDYRPDVFGNYVAIFTAPDLLIRLVSDRSQVFVEIRVPGGHWCDKELLWSSAAYPEPDIHSTKSACGQAMTKLSKPAISNSTFRSSSQLRP